MSVSSLRFLYDKIISKCYDVVFVMYHVKLQKDATKYTFHPQQKIMPSGHNAGNRMQLILPITKEYLGWVRGRYPHKSKGVQMNGTEIDN